MKRPNGYGSVCFLGAGRRRPWAVKVSAGEEVVNHRRRRIRKYLGYYATEDEAIRALLAYNDNPLAIEALEFTFADVFNNWSAEFYRTISSSNQGGYNAAYKICTPLYEMKFKDIRRVHLQSVIDNCNKNYPTLKKLKVLLHQIYKYALRHDLVLADYSQYIDISQYKDLNPDKIERTIFSQDEINKLWSEVQLKEYYQIPLLLIYSGLRLSELRELKSEHVHLDKRYFDIISAKTKAGIRQVPICDKIMPFVKHWLNKDTEYFISSIRGNMFNDTSFRKELWKPTMSDFKMNHFPHDGRHTTVSLLTEALVDERIIKQIVGHAGGNITQDVYTHISLDTKLEAMNKI